MYKREKHKIQAFVNGKIKSQIYNNNEKGIVYFALTRSLCMRGMNARGFIYHHAKSYESLARHTQQGYRPSKMKESRVKSI